MAVSIANTDNKTFTDFSSSPQSASVNIGAAVADRLVFCELFNVDANSTGVFMSDVKLNGVAANPVPGAYFTDGVTGESAVYWASVPLGATATLTIDFNATPSDGGLNVSVYRVVGADTTTPVAASNSAGSDLTGTPSAAITIPSGGVLLAMASAIKTNILIFSGWSGATQDQSITGVIGGIVRTDTETALSSTPGSPTVSATFNSITNFLSLVAIQQASAPPPAANDRLFTRQLRY